MKFIRILLVILVFYLAYNFYSSRIEKKTRPELLKKVLSVSTNERVYLISANSEDLKHKKAPLVIFLHGMDSLWPDPISTKLQYNFITAKAEKNNYIAVFPKGSKGSCDWDNEKYIKYYCWSTTTDIDRNFIRLLNYEINKEYGTNPQKTFLVGFSNGGYFVTSYIFRHHINDFSGYGIHAGGGYLMRNDPILDEYTDKFLISMNVGRNDEFQLKIMRELRDTFIALGWKPSRKLRYKEFEGDHAFSINAFNDEMEFFLKNTN